MVEREARLEEARQRALIISEHIRGRSDLEARQTIGNFTEPLEFERRLADLAIAPEAWEHIVNAGIDPRLVFAHPALLQAHPQTSLHYRESPPCPSRGCSLWPVKSRVGKTALCAGHLPRPGVSR